MALRDDIRSIFVIGSGPIVIGQACEFDYSGTQAVRVLRELGFRVILLNSNPATIMTDPDLADATYIEPITPEYAAAIIELERPDAILPTMGGQTALNVAVELAEGGALDKYGVELIGASLDSIKTAEDREAFKSAMIEIGLDVPRSGAATSNGEAVALADEIGYPVVVRAAFTLGGAGSGTAHDRDELVAIAAEGIKQSPVDQVLIEESVHGWKEFELEVMRDLDDNCVIICSIENIDPMGVHTGDSITVAPAQTLSDVEYQAMRDAALACMRRIGVSSGGSNVQFALDPASGRMVIIEMNPRVSRSSALASKATGFPIAKMAAQLAVGLTLDEIPNDITKKTPACFEPVIDYVVTKIPRFAFEKFPGADDTLGTTMRSVGEVMAIGRTFEESLQKAVRSLELGRSGLNADPEETVECDFEALVASLERPTPGRLFDIETALRGGATIERVHALTGVDPWFLEAIEYLGRARIALEALGFDGCSREKLREAKRLGFSDAQLAHLWCTDEGSVRKLRVQDAIIPVFKTVDTCAAEFEAHTPYHYSTYEDVSEVSTSERPRVLILGAGPNRIGQGIEFDYCCVHAVYALEEAGFETVMLNCNPETVSTDYDTASQLFFEPLTVEDVLAVVDAVSPVGVILQLGGQTPLKLAHGLSGAGVAIAGTSPDSIDLAEDRRRFGELCDSIGLRQPRGGIAVTRRDAEEIAETIGPPVLLRPSYVLGGRAMQILYSATDVGDAVDAMTDDTQGPYLIDRFLEDAIEVDVDCCFDGETFLLGGVLEHIEEAGVHSGDSACVIPPTTLSAATVDEIVFAAEKLARALDVRGLLNVQFAVRDDEIYVIEANPRASRTVPFISKATNVPLAKIAARIAMGETIASLAGAGYLPFDPARLPHIAVKEAVLPFRRFVGADSLLGPEMRSTGEVMGISRRFGAAFGKAQVAAGMALPAAGCVFISVADRDKGPALLSVACDLHELGFVFAATSGTREWLERAGVSVVEPVVKLSDDQSHGVTAVDLIEDGEICLVINTPRGRGPHADGMYIRNAAVHVPIPIVTTVSGARAAVAAIRAERRPSEVVSLQAWHGIMEMTRAGAVST